MAFRRTYAILALAGTALGQVGSGSGVETQMPMSSSMAGTMPTETTQSEATSTSDVNYSSIMITTNPSSSTDDMDYTTSMPAEETASMTTDDSMTAMSTYIPEDPAMSSQEPTIDSMSTAMTNTPSMTTSISMNMPMGTGGMVMPNATATGQHPISGSGMSGVSAALFTVSVLLGLLVHL
ncbi:hypothetical protein BJ170DRAFT_452010 [Xylariales sp. AK1849]|nr:hypothetical protein BJ170DRAFT_452010 [Xylariales sp. AK1849]